MSTCVALLRAINVGAHGRVTGERLREIAAGAGYPDARTYLQSGNIALDAGGDTPDAVARALGAGLGAEGLRARVLVRTGDELERVARAHPFEALASHESQLHVTFLAGAAAAGRAASVPRVDGDDHSQVAGGEVYLWCPGGYGRTRLNNAFVERALRVEATTRGWRTVRALAAMCAGARA